MLIIEGEKCAKLRNLYLCHFPTGATIVNMNRANKLGLVVWLLTTSLGSCNVASSDNPALDSDESGDGSAEPDSSENPLGGQVGDEGTGGENKMCSYERWPGPESQLAVYQCLHRGGTEWECSCGDASALVVESSESGDSDETCEAVLHETCGSPPESEFCRNSETTVCWPNSGGEEGFICSCDDGAPIAIDSQSDCEAALRTACGSTTCSVEDVGQCVPSASADSTYECTCSRFDGNGRSSDLSSCQDALESICMAPEDVCYIGPTGCNDNANLCERSDEGEYSCWCNGEVKVVSPEEDSCELAIQLACDSSISCVARSGDEGTGGE